MQQLLGQTVICIGGSAGIGLETARLARTEGADVVLTGRDADRLDRAATEVGAQRTAAFDATDDDALRAFFGTVTTVDHILITAGGPRYVPLLQMNSAEVREALGQHVTLALEVARSARSLMQPGGSLVLMGGTGGRRIDHRLGIVPAATAAREILRRLHYVMASKASPQAKLNLVVSIIAQVLNSEVCSIYLLREGVLELFATRGLAPEAVHVTKLAMGEGLVGTIAANVEMLNLAEAAALSDRSACGRRGRRGPAGGARGHRSGCPRCPTR